MAAEPIDVFISSTCDDLTDLRAALAAHLRELRFKVAISEDHTSAFYVEPSANTIDICLDNIANSKIVLCIIDRRYGTALKGGDHDGQSATQAEIMHAQSLNKKVLFFVRDAAWNDYQQLKVNLNAITKWVEPNDKSQRDAWFKFFNGVIVPFPGHDNRSSWCNFFNNVVDLKDKVTSRIIAEFPQYAGTLALAPERFVRLTFGLDRFDHGPPPGIIGSFRNLGIGPAFNIKHGIHSGQPRIACQQLFEPIKSAGLREGEFLRPLESRGHPYIPAGSVGIWKIYCEYENRFKDRYRVEAPFFGNGAAFRCENDEEFYIANGTALNTIWTRVL